MMWWGSSMSSGSWMAMMMAVVMVLVAMALIAIIRGLQHARRSGESNSAARQTLDGRFARGEINADEYRARQDALAK
jgi:putative membrane protein